MSHPLLPDALWNLIQPLLPPSPCRFTSLPDRACFMGILFVLRSGIPWEMLPQELGCASWHDLLAAVTRLARGGHLATDPLLLAGLAGT